MRDYHPMPDPLPGERYYPSNSADSYSFIESFCTHCSRDKPCSEGKNIDDCTDDEVCEILAASFLDGAVEWRRLENGTTTCLAYIGTPIGTRRCLNTVDMFEQPSSAVENKKQLSGAKRPLDWLG